jgi:hypothetical protein
MRFLQNILSTVGMTALSTVFGFLAVAALTALTQRPSEEPWTRGFGQYLGGLICGAPLGAAVGFLGSILFIRVQDGSVPWNPIVWLGILLGLLTGTTLSFHWGMTSGQHWWLAVTVLAAASATVGGLLARLGLAVCKSVTKTRRGPGQ